VLIDDDDSTHFLVRHLLRRAGFNLPWRMFSNGDRCLPYFEECAAGREPWPYVVFLDLNMPGISGFDVLKWLGEHEYLSHTMVAIISGSTDVADASRAFGLGAHAYIGKSPKTEILSKVVSDAIYSASA
jgi:DNA-binding NtrC family response regulator